MDDLDALNGMSKAGSLWSVVGVMMQTMIEISRNGLQRCMFCRAAGWVLERAMESLQHNLTSAGNARHIGRARHEAANEDGFEMFMSR